MAALHGFARLLLRKHPHLMARVFIRHHDINGSSSIGQFFISGANICSSQFSWMSLAWINSNCFGHSRTQGNFSNIIRFVYSKPSRHNRNHFSGAGEYRAKQRVPPLTGDEWRAGSCWRAYLLTQIVMSATNQHAKLYSGDKRLPCS